MPTATLTTLLCVSQSTGTDFAVNNAVFGLLPSAIPFDEGWGRSVLDVLKDLPGVIAAIDQARSDPDQIYITVGTNSGREHAVWPRDPQEVEMQAAQSQDLNMQLQFDNSLNLSLWDEDVSGEDLLGSITIYNTEAGQGEKLAKAYSDVEGSCYYLRYRVD